MTDKSKELNVSVRLVSEKLPFTGTAGNNDRYDQLHRLQETGRQDWSLRTMPGKELCDREGIPNLCGM
jgi:hypothetical protein